MKQVHYFLIVFAAVCWASIGLFIKKLSALGFSTWEMLFVKVVFATLILLLFLLCKNKSFLCLKRPKHILYFIGTGIISYTFFSLSYMFAISLTSLGVAAVLLYTSPTIVMIFSIFLFKEKLTGRKIITLFTTFVGCVLVTGLGLGDSSSMSFWGIFFGLSAGLGYALYSIFGALALKAGYNALSITFYTFLLSALFLVFFVNPLSIVKRITETGMWPYMIFFAAITTLLPYLAYTIGLSRIKPSKASILATIEPVVAALLGILIFQEEAGALKLLGMALVLSAVLSLDNEDQKPDVLDLANED